MSLLEARDLVKHYPGVRAVQGISFGVRRGECFGLLGPNGAGKTTTVEMLEGILPPTSGQVLYEGAPLDMRFREVAGIQFQSTALQDHLSVLQTLQFFSRLYRHTRQLDEVIDICDLGNLLERDNRKLSGGQRQRLLLAIALVNDPAVVFLDEPTTGLDPQARRNFWDLIRRIRMEDKTVILTTHYMEEAYLLCDRILIVDHGRIIAEGSPSKLLQEHFSDVILTIPATDWSDSGEKDCPFLVMKAGDMVELSTPDVDAAIDWLRSSRIPLAGLRIRPRTLEDLFIELTGKELRA